MARYIDADKLELKIEDKKWYPVLYRKRSSSDPVSIWLAPVCKVDDVFEAIENVPTADVVEVRKGVWIEEFLYARNYDDYYQYTCSKCRSNTDEPTQYCPNCGVKEIKVIKIKKNPDDEHVAEVRKALRENGGYCPCAVTKSADTKCIC